MRGIRERIAGAPASWGICELPDWGRQLPAQQVLADMRRLGLSATELGPEGFLPGQPAEQIALLEMFGLAALGAFCPLILHDSRNPPDEHVADLLAAFDRLGASTMVIAAATGTSSYDERPQLDDGEWKLLIRNLERMATLAGERGVTACIHPHIGTLVETPREVQRVLDDCTVPLCLDSGHLAVGGSDPVAIAQSVPERIAHVHLKDVDLSLAASVQETTLTYTGAVAAGLYTTLGQGDVDLGAIVRSLEGAGYAGWYVPELDRMLPCDPSDDHPIDDVRASIDALCELT